jgi:rare lipoprotein A (peptidoglycan hydrolase)
VDITRKFIILVIALTLIAIPFLPRINAEKSSAVFNGESVLIVDNGYEFSIKAYGNTLQELLKNAGIILHEKDIVFPDRPTNFQKVIIIRSMNITLNLYGQKQEITSVKRTVEEVLNENNIKISGEDTINYSLGTEIFPGMEIEIQKKPTPPPLPILPKPKPKSVVAPSNQIVKTGESQTGVASWYNYVPGNYCASLRFPRGSKLLVTNTANGKSVIVTVNDKGPFSNKVIDIERTAFLQIGSLSSGVLRVKVERIR